MDDTELAAIRARAAASTPGPWLVETGWASPWHPGIIPASYGDTNMRRIVGSSESEGGVWDSADAEFIAHSREDVPALVAEVERLRALVEQQV